MILTHIAIRALPDLCFGIEYRGVWGVSSFSLQITLVTHLEPRFERPGLSFCIARQSG
jgi:hypothetical protein